MPPPRRDLDRTREQLCAWLAAKLPGARELHITELTGPSETGFSSDTLMFDAEWTARNRVCRERLVARFKPQGMTLFPNYDVGMQYRIMKSLRDTDVPVPRVRWLEEDEGPLGSPFYVMDRLDGRVFPDNPPYHTGGWVAEITPEEREALWWSGFDALARVHRLDWRGLGLDFLPRPEHGRTPLEQQLHEYDEFLDWGMDRSRLPLIERARRWLNAHKPAEEPVGLCWGDSRPGNQIFDGRECIAVIDWEMARLGDPVQDLAWWVALDRCFSEGVGVERLAGFPDRRQTIRRWEELVGREARHVVYYEVLGFYKFSIIMSRVVLQLKHYAVLPADTNMDIDNLASQTLARALDEVGA
jgi:aminoglycoside phosphotransferase (APT) family kinase protein